MIQRAVVVVLFVLLGGQGLNGQVRVGVLGGVNYADFTYSGSYHSLSEDWNARPAPLFSFLVDIQIAHHLQIAAQIGYIEKGMESKLHPWGGPEEIDPSYWTLSNHYLEASFFLRWNSGDTAIRFYLEGGPAVAHLLSARAEGKAYQGSSEVTLDTKIYFHDLDFSLAAGAGVEYEFVPGVFAGVSWHYVQGVIELSPEFTDVHTKGIQVACVVLVTV